MQNICRLQNRHVLLIIILDEKDTVNVRFFVLFFNSSFFHSMRQPHRGERLSCAVLFVIKIIIAKCESSDYNNEKIKNSE